MMVADRMTGTFALAGNVCAIQFRGAAGKVTSECRVNLFPNDPFAFAFLPPRARLSNDAKKQRLLFFHNIVVEIASSLFDRSWSNPR